MDAKIIDSGISVKHAKNWQVGEALREILQNYLDVRKEFGCKGMVTYKNGYAIVKDFGPGMQLAHLAFGNNDKATDSIGQFGEGLKSAFVTLLRENRKIELRTSGMVIRPFVQVSDNFGTETLHYKVSAYNTTIPTRLAGTFIVVECTKEELEIGKSFFVEFSSTCSSNSEKIAGIIWLEKNRISLPGGTVYVKGSAVASIDKAMFSYHLTGEEAAAATNRDRNAVDMNKVTPCIENMLGNTASAKVKRAILEDIFTNKQSAWESSLDIVSSYYQEKAWHRAWVTLYGRNYVVSFNSECDNQALYRGYKLIRGLGYSHRNFLKSFGMRDSSEFYKASKSTKESAGRVARKDFTEEETATIKKATKLVKKFYADPGKVVVVENVNALMHSAGTQFAGFYDSQKDTIYIKRTQLADLKAFLHTLLHETCHKVSGYSDITAEFERALLDIAVNIIAE